MKTNYTYSKVDACRICLAIKLGCRQSVIAAGEQLQDLQILPITADNNSAFSSTGINTYESLQKQ